MMSSIPCDWWMRCFVEAHVDEEAFASLRVPDVDTDIGLGAKRRCARRSPRLPRRSFRRMGKIRGRCSRTAQDGGEAGDD